MDDHQEMILLSYVGLMGEEFNKLGNFNESIRLIIKKKIETIMYNWNSNYYSVTSSCVDILSLLQPCADKYSKIIGQVTQIEQFFENNINNNIAELEHTQLLDDQYNPFLESEEEQHNDTQPEETNNQLIELGVHELLLNEQLTNSLMEKCDFFRVLLDNNTNFRNFNSISLPPDLCPCIPFFLAYLQTGTTNLTAINVYPLHKLADYFMFNGLIQFCKDYLHNLYGWGGQIKK